MASLTRTIVLVALAACTLGGCGRVGYYAHSIRGQLDVLSRREPIEILLQDTGTDAALAARLKTVRDVREFASAELALPDNGSYRSYADLGRPYVVWNVFAAPEFSVEPKTWCFPFVGCVAYRGYFDEARAERFAQGLSAKGYDVYIGGVPAYSTLGKFDDPVMNTMLHWDDSYLAGIIFHELAHQVLYLKGDTAFSEAFAEVVEGEGVRRWLIARGRSEEYERYLRGSRRSLEFGELISATRERLRELYASGLGEGAMRAAKSREFDRLRADYRTLRAGWGDEQAFDAWFDRELNNAHLASVATYRDLVPALGALLAESGSDLPLFYRRAAELAKLPEAAREDRLQRLEGGHAGRSGDR